MTLPRRLRTPSLLLMLLLVAGPLAAAASGHRSRGAGPSGISVTGALSEAWAFVSRIWAKAGGSSDPFGKAGNSIDPFGKEGSSSDPFGKAGSGSDPFGKAGGGIDPFGQPAPSTLPLSPASSTENRPASGN
jgi:hypothetical protein